MLQRSVALGIVAAGQTVVILLGSLDLSVATLISLASLLDRDDDGRPGRPTSSRRSALVLALGVGVGLVNGLIITKLQVNAFIATLGTALIIKGLIDNSWDGPAGGVPRRVLRRASATRASACSRCRSSCSPAIAAIGLVHPALHRFGYRIYAVGGNEDVSKLSGLRTHRTIIARAHRCARWRRSSPASSWPAASGPARRPVGTDGGYDLESIAAVVLGGTALTGGRGGVIGTIGGVFILAVLDNTFNQLELNAFLKDVVRGIIIIAAVAVYARRHGEEGMSTENAAVAPASAPTSGDRGRRFLSSLMSTGTIFVLLLILWIWITILNPTFAEPGPFLAYLKRSAPLVILAAGAVLRARQRQLRPLGRLAGDRDGRGRRAADRRRPVARPGP